MKKRVLSVDSQRKAISLIKEYMAQNMPMAMLLPGVTLIWFDRDKEEDDSVGCPCFLASAVDGGKEVTFYAKIFAKGPAEAVKIYEFDLSKAPFMDVIKDGEVFDMKDIQHRYQNQRFIYKDGMISEIA